MSVLVAIKSRDGIVMASDSQSTSEISKHLHSQKIHTVSRGRDSALFGMVGNDDKNRITLQKLKNFLIQSGEPFEKVLSEAVRELRREPFPQKSGH